MNVQGWICLALLLWFPMAFTFAASRTGGRGGYHDRRSVVTGFAEAALGLGIGHAIVPWDVIPPAVWAVPATITACGAVVVVRVWPTLPVVVGARPRLRLVGTALGVAFCAVVVAVMV